MTAPEASIGLARPAVILCADDYALTQGVSAAIEELAAAGRLSATSVLVDRPYWREQGQRILAFRERLALGLHLNFTLGKPPAPLPSLAPGGAFLSHSALLLRAARGGIDPVEVRGEVLRQLDLFERVAGRPPDMIDGHQHVHAYPGLRQPVLEALASRFPGEKPLVRDPSDSLAAIIARRSAIAKAATLALLTRGFSAQARRLGFPTNRGFSGVSNFTARIGYDVELRRNLESPGPCHLVMCHPGYPEEELERLDPVVTRRRAELDALKSMPDLDGIIWRPSRLSPAGRIDWPGSC
jgi:predicted glycoside hydrolase/deacetylase ChbG (UPF0249 family)